MFSFITAYFQISPEHNKYYFDNFYKLAETNFPIILFLDNTLSNEVQYIENKYTNVKIILSDWNILYSNLGLSEEEIYNLETPNNNPKDNIKYLTLMNCKPFFLKQALEYTVDNTLVWIDFVILKITNDIEHFKSNFKKLS